ncbi:MAG: S41 family peptidase, partial [Bacteroidota bacterium]
MKTSALLLALFLLPVTLLGQQFTNLNFDGEGGWQAQRLTQGDFLVTQPAGEGRCAMLTGPFTDYESGYVCQEIPLAVTKVGRYQVTAKIKTEGVVGNGAQVYAYGKVAGVTKGYQQSASLTGDNAWQEVSFELILDAEMDTLRLGCYLHGEGKAWFDDLSFREYVPKYVEASPVARAYLTAFFDTVRQYALGRETIDWAALERDAWKIAADAQAPADVYTTIAYTLRRINKHSFFTTPEVSAQWAGADLPNDQPDPNLRYTTGRRINEEVAYLSMPSMGSSHQPTIAAFADSLHGLIAALDTEGTTGWILDLRKNEGGNCWPMLAGVGPLLGEGICGHFQDPDGGNAHAWAYREGTSTERGNDRVSTRNYRLKNPHARIAVLTGPQTVSSGEV